VSEKLRVLMVEDSENDALLILRALQGTYDIAYDRVDALNALEEALDRQEWDLILSDYVMPRLTGHDALELVQKKNLDIPFIIVSGNIGEQVAVDVMKAGAHDYILKDNLQRLAPAVRREVGEAAARRARRRAEEALRRSEREMADFFDNGAIGLRLCGPDGTILRANRAELDMLGYAQHEYLGRPLFHFHADAEVPKEIFRRLQNNESVQNLETRLLRKDGSELPALVSANALWEDGRIVHARFFTRDLSPVKRLEQELKAARRELESGLREGAKKAPAARAKPGAAAQNGRAGEERELLFNLSRDLLGVAGLDGLLKDVNPAWEKTLGWSREDLLSTPYMELVHPDDRPKTQEQLENLGAGGDMAAYEVRLKRADGSYRWTSWNATPIPAKRLIVCAGRDVTDRRRNEEDRARLAAIVESSSDAVVAQTLDGSILSWNSAAEKMYGYSFDEVRGKRAVSLLMPDRPEDKPHILDRVRRGESVETFETVHTRKDGAAVHVSLSVSPIAGQDGSVTGAAMIIRDITAQKKMEKAVLHSERLAAMGQMAAGVAHELKTPMTVILGFVEVLLEQLEAGKAPLKDLKDHLETIKQQVTRCTGLANNLLDFSRKEKGADAAFDVNDAVRAALSLVKPMAIDKSVSIAVDLAAEPLELMGRPDMVQQVVINLCLNAVEAMPQGGKLSVATSRQAGKAPAARIRVSDTGPGMPAAVQKRIFQPFFTTKGAKGNGLGLWLVKEIASEMGGKVECASREGEGTAFTVTLPLEGA
jgi:PAS domain S-box-containing protein